MSPYFYVIAPISLDKNYCQKKEILVELSVKSGIRPHFPLDNRAEEKRSILDVMIQAAFVFVDLTLERPSCYYELGMAEAILKPVFLLALTGTPIHQTQGEIHFYANLNEYKSLAGSAIKSLTRSVATEIDSISRDLHVDKVNHDER